MKCSVFFSIDHIVRIVSIWLMRISAVALILIAALSFVDVLGRYFVRHSLTGAQDMIEVTMCVFVYGGMAMAIRQRKCIAVPVILDGMKRRPRQVVTAAGNLVCFVMSIFLIAELLIQTGAMMEKMNVGTAVIKISYMPFYAFATFGFVVIALELILVSIKDFRGLTDNPETDLETDEAVQGGTD